MGNGTEKRRKTDSLPTRRIEEAATGPRPRGDATTRPGAKGHPPALIVPVCNLETFYAAIAYGADGVRVGLEKLDPSRPGMGLEELDVAVGHAHALRRAVYVDLSGSVPQRGLGPALEALALCEELGVDGIRLDDMGLFRAIREYFPRLGWHAGEALSVRSVETARWLERNGFARARVAPDLSSTEITEVAHQTELALEFPLMLPGADCADGRLRITGRGAQGREDFTCDADFRLPADAKDAGGADLRRTLELLADAPVAAICVEPSAVAPYLVAATTDLYRKLLDRADLDLKEALERLAEMARRASGRGAVLGRVSKILNGRASFRTETAFERHDSLLAGRDEVEFKADRINRKGERVFQAAAAEEVSIVVPESVREGDELRIVATQGEAREFSSGVPNQTARARLPVRLVVTLNIDPEGAKLAELGLPGNIEIVGRVNAVEIKRSYPAKLLFADSQPLTEERVEEFFERLASTRFELKSFSAVVPAGVFVPAAEINEARRQFFVALESAVVKARKQRTKAALDAVCGKPEPETDESLPRRFVALVDRAVYIDALPLIELDEVVYEIGHDSFAEVDEAHARWGDKLRIAVPRAIRRRDEVEIARKLIALYEAGVRRFQVADLCAFEYVARVAGIDKRRRMDTNQVMRRSLHVSTRRAEAIFEPRIPDFARRGVDLVADYHCMTLSREAARSWREQGASRITLAPGDTLENMRAILEEFSGVCDVVAYARLSRFEADRCVYAALLGRCPGREACDFTQLQVKSAEGEEFTASDDHCRTVVPGDEEYNAAERLAELEAAGVNRFRLDFRGGEFTAEKIRSVCAEFLKA